MIKKIVAWHNVLTVSVHLSGWMVTDPTKFYSLTQNNIRLYFGEGLNFVWRLFTKCSHYLPLQPTFY